MRFRVFLQSEAHHAYMHDAPVLRSFNRRTIQILPFITAGCGGNTLQPAKQKCYKLFIERFELFFNVAVKVFHNLDHSFNETGD